MPQMETDLYDFISKTAGKERGLDERIALEVIRPVVSALKHIQRLGYVHRDIKSENVLLEVRSADHGAGDGLALV